MKTKSNTTRLALAGLLAAALIVVPFVSAQVAPAASAAAAAADARKEEALKLEAFTVTGSNIKRMEIEKVLPVTVFNREMMDSRNAITPVELLTALPQVTSVPLNESTNGGANSMSTANGGGGGGGGGCVVARTGDGTLTGGSAVATPAGALQMLLARRR